MKWFNTITISILILINFIYFGGTLKLPSYIKPCFRADPPNKLNECAKKHGQEAIPYIVKGDSKFGTPVLDPLQLEHIEIATDRDFKVSLFKIKINGLKNTEILDLSVNLDKSVFNGTIKIPELLFNSQYDAKGRILVIPFDGNGTATLKLYDAVFKMGYTTEFETRNGKKYYKLKEIDIDYSIGNATVQLDHLFRQNEQLGKDVNKFLNKNWPAFADIIKKPVRETIQNFIYMLMNRLYSKVEADAIFV